MPDLLSSALPASCGETEGPPTEAAARQRDESLQRRRADQRLIQLLAKDDFRGARYDEFENNLARYAVSVLRAWMSSGYIFTMTARHGFGLALHEYDLERLATDSDLRDQLATMTVAVSLPRFREKALVKGDWTLEGGSSITTYFLGACLHHFSNEFRSYRTSEEHHRRALLQPHYLSETLPGVEAEVVGRDLLRDMLDDVAPGKARERAIVALTLDGYTQQEICHILNETSIRAIEGVMHRWRKAAQRKLLRDRGEERE
ncbi:sigma-70 family RNA polymerase sigma factor [Streptomyces ossamyceticus]|uniref:sigma-70 family RNA polymerase sigma factor n=1 Tax=Streptomyces ossamyceticus TaxID=249581 RepID=UPI0006E2BDC2|nr:sigma-70 family RNA polymerase sigma factor [Streptomyces ossamyceticus]